MKSGIRGAIAIDMEEAKSLHRSGFRVSHVGHLGQVPRGDVRYVLETLKPEVMTVYNLDKARQISDAAKSIGTTQKLLLRVIGAGEIAYDTLGGGVYEKDILSEARALSALPGVKLAGVTTYPAMRYNLRTRG